jgi:hypothetical protein
LANERSGRLTDCGQPFFLCILPIDKCGQVWYNTNREFIGPTMGDMARIFKKSSLFQIFPSNFLCPPPADFFPKSSAPRGRCYVNLFKQPEHRAQLPIWPSILLKGPGWDVPDRVRRTWTYMAFFSVESDRPICPGKFPKTAYGRSVCVKPIGLLLFSPIIYYNIFFIKSQTTGASTDRNMSPPYIISYFFININPIGPR